MAKELIRDQQGACKDWQQAVTLGIEHGKTYLQDCK
jgi:hypothetical protein